MVEEEHIFTYLGYVMILFIVSRILLAAFIGKEKLASFPNEKEGENLAGERTNNLTLAGFSLAALTLFLAFVGHPSVPTIKNMTSSVTITDVTLTDTVFYLSVSLICFVIAAYLFGIRVNRAFSYAADTFEALGLLAVAIAMLSFFTTHMTVAANTFAAMYTLFFSVIVAIVSLNYFYTYKMLQNISTRSTSLTLEINQGTIQGRLTTNTPKGAEQGVGLTTLSLVLGPITTTTVVTAEDGRYTATFNPQPNPGNYTVQAHFAGTAVYRPSTSSKQNISVG